MVGEQRKRLLEDPKLRPGRGVGGPPRFPDRPERFREGLEGQLGTDQLDRVPEQLLEPRIAGDAGKFEDQPSLADPCFACDEHRGPTPRLCRQESRPKLGELRSPTDVQVARATCHAASIAPEDQDLVCERNATRRKPHARADKELGVTR